VVDSPWPDLSLKTVPDVPNLPVKCLILLRVTALPRECSTTELRQRAHPQMRPTTTSRKRPIA
jgi:hypothetical protein